MNLPFFYLENFDDSILVLDEERSKHIVQVLRKKKGDKILLTNGKGKNAEAEIINDNRKKCEVKIMSVTKALPKSKKISIAISPIKNASRFEWFLEKATELGVREIIPLVCERTEKQNFRYDRMQNILISAMLQSQQSWLPVLHKPISFIQLIQSGDYNQKYIAHCIEAQKKSLTTQSINESSSQLILIGPEGDFTPEEVASALANNFIDISLGNTRLRTETAGIVAATLLCIG